MTEENVLVITNIVFGMLFIISEYLGLSNCDSNSVWGVIGERFCLAKKEEKVCAKCEELVMVQV